MNKIRNNMDTLRRQLGWTGPSTALKTGLRVATRLTIACLLLSFFGSSGLATTGLANGPTTVSINPASQEISLGTTGSTDVLIEDVTDLYGFEFQITFDPTLVEVVDANPVQAGVQIQPGDFLSPDWLLDNTVDNDNGTIAYALCQLSPSQPQSGDGVLAIITWRGKVMGTSPITFTHVQLGAPGGVPIPATSQDGEITVGEPSPGPTITSLSPDWATAGGPAFTLTVNGANFVSGSTVQWDGAARTTTFVSSTQLTAAITAADIATAGTANVTVVNPAPGGGTSNAFPFTITNPAPAITSLSPDSATMGGPAFTLTVNGSNFVSDSTVHWDGSPRTTAFVSSTRLTADITAADIATVGTVSVTVVNLLAPGGGTSNALSFTISNPTPTITSLSPVSATVGGPAFTLTVNGTDFVSGSTVHWDGAARTTAFVSSTQLTGAITAADIAALGTVSVTVVNPPPDGGASNTLPFEITEFGPEPPTNFVYLPLILNN